MDDYYYERNQFPFPMPGMGGMGGMGGLPFPMPFGGMSGMSNPFGAPQRPALPPPRPVVAQPIHIAPMQPAYAAPPPPMPYSPPPPMPFPGATPPPWMGQWGGPCGSGLLGGLFGNRRILPILVDQVLKGWAAFSGKPELPTGDQLNQVSNVFSYLDTAAQYVKRDEQIRFFGGLARDIL